MNEEARGHYHDEIAGEVAKLSKYLPEGAPILYVPHENFNRDIGVAKRQKFTVEGTPFEGSDAEWDDYITSHLPTKEDEESLKEIFEQDWIENKPMSTRQIESGIGATA